MHPWLVRWGELEIPTYLAMIALGATLATFVLRREATRSRLPVRAVFDLALLVLPAGFLGARVAFAFTRPDVYGPAPWLILSPAGGFTFYGAFFGAVTALVLGAWWRGLDPWRVLDVYAPCMPFGVVYGRLGCLGAGCCHGRAADWPLGVDVPWAVTYTLPGTVAEPLLGVPLHPTPLYDGFVGLAVFLAADRLRTVARRPGEVFLGVVGLYAVGRFVTEVFRGDAVRGFVLDGLLSTAQATGVVVVAVLALVLPLRRRACIPSSST